MPPPIASFTQLQEGETKIAYRCSQGLDTRVLIEGTEATPRRRTNPYVQRYGINVVEHI